MKKQVLIIGLIFLATQTFAQIFNPEQINYGGSMTMIGSGSGHGTNVSMNFVAANEFKAIEFGSIFRKDIPQWKGVDFKYKVFTGKNYIYYNNTMIKPYIMYNCVYQSEYVFENKVLSTPKATYEIPDETGGRISTMEHYLGVGASFKFINSFFIDMSFAAGAYLGSLKKNSTPQTIGIHSVNSGLTTSFKVGIGYYLF
ncbi:MAG: hypothetical protein ACOC3T_05495 [Bacteroidota bacterium]